jgi:hypothetical protein
MVLRERRTFGEAINWLSNLTTYLYLHVATVAMTISHVRTIHKYLALGHAIPVPFNLVPNDGCDSLRRNYPPPAKANNHAGTRSRLPKYYHGLADN